MTLTLVKHLTLAQLEAGLDEIIRYTPKDKGRLMMIVRRPADGVREELDEAQLDPVEGLVGDTWRIRASKRTADGSAHPDMQLNIMNARVADLIAHGRGRMALAGDQLFIDLDLTGANLPPGTRLAIGSAEIEVTAQPHTGCEKFIQRFGVDAAKFVNSPRGRELHLRGINAKVVKAGTIRLGDAARKISAER